MAGLSGSYLVAWVLAVRGSQLLRSFRGLLAAFLVTFTAVSIMAYSLEQLRSGMPPQGGLPPATPWMLAALTVIPFAYLWVTDTLEAAPEDRRGPIWSLWIVSGLFGFLLVLTLIQMVMGSRQGNSYDMSVMPSLLICGVTCIVYVILDTSVWRRDLAPKESAASRDSAEL